VTYPIVWLFDIDTDEISDSANELADRASGAPAVALFLLAVLILAPFCEELFFRGLLFEAYKKRRNLPWLASLWPQRRRPDVDGRRWNLVIAYVASSAVFSAGHFDLLLFPGLMLAGFVFAYMAQRYGRLGPAIWAHFGFNGTTALALLVLDDDEALPAIVRAVVG
jgi:membrane protease YdiL (CAAX protease family)